MVNRFSDLLARGPEGNTCGALLDELIKCTKLHFAMEEALMRSIGGVYADAAVHKAQHSEMLEVVIGLQARVRSGAISAPPAHFLQQWLLRHIKESDKALAAAANSAVRPALTVH